LKEWILMPKCVGCQSEMHASVATTTQSAINVLVKREGGRPADIPKKWRSGPLCPRCQAAWSAAIGLRNYVASRE
jgi:hypothetical protein